VVLRRILSSAICINYLHNPSCYDSSTGLVASEDKSNPHPAALGNFDPELRNLVADVDDPEENVVYAYEDGFEVESRAWRFCAIYLRTT
jgi:hypothetical protein